MNVWQPEPDETLLSRSSVTFASGAATRVKGMRWFRDTDRKDIQGELPGWPEGPVYVPRSTGESIGRIGVKGAATALGVAVMAVLSSAGGNVSGSSGPDSGKDTPDDHENEVEDFPVMWAALGTTARTLPWQLDPGRSDEKHYRTHAIVTDRRLVIVGLPHLKKNDKIIEDEVLWETPLSAISGVEHRDFKDGHDVKITFTDASWCRLSSFQRARLTRYLRRPLEVIPLDALTPAQRSAVEDFLATAHAPDIGTPVVTRRPCGHFRAEALVPSELTSLFGAGSRSLSMDSDGKKLNTEEYHPEDF
ncbi:hypothetical protein J8N05_09140 [Streptomyces sp. BH-SS-21]|uniref:Uncharacterized protein n=1 Tax=Streptomyces liliiviolaceus TaxID=2823109 RepID=A0A940XWM3_9ACTN|nr:hypothetical protein [Streptomyces liliiviolaceus]MBQ0848376.1 hypothetical protein [Streptomyces liliiviolaceus]